MFKKILANLPIYRQDLQEKGLYYSIIDRLKRNQTFSHIYNSIKPDHINFNGQTLFIDPEDTVVSEYLLRTKQWEPFEISIFKQCLRAGDTVIDLGAYIGTYTLTAAKIVGKKGQIFAFEPSPRNYALLSKNVAVNRLKNVQAINQAVSNRAGSLKLYLAENTGDNRIYGDSINQSSVEVKAITLDSFFKKKLPKINLIKMDIQGAEILALQGAAQLLKKNQDLIIITEFWPAGLKMVGSSPSAFIKLLAATDFKFYEINEAAQTVKAITAQQILKNYQHNDQITTNLLCARSGNKRLSHFN